MLLILNLILMITIQPIIKRLHFYMFIYIFYILLLFLTFSSSCAKKASMASHWATETRGFSLCCTPSAVILQYTTVCYPTVLSYRQLLSYSTVYHSVLSYSVILPSAVILQDTTVCYHTVLSYRQLLSYSIPQYVYPLVTIDTFFIRF